MRLAVVQHKIRGDRDADALAFSAAARSVAEQGAELVVLCEVPSMSGSPDADVRDLVRGSLGAIPYVLPHLDPERRAGVFEGVDLPGITDRLGPLVVLEGDACMSADLLSRVAAARPAVAILLPRSESDLQAEAMLELAIGLSYSLAGLVIVAEASGAEPGAAGHGGSVIVSVGEVVAEAIQDDDLLLADILEPAPQPTPRAQIPDIPTILEQRIAQHAGLKIATEYPSDLA